MSFFTRVRGGLLVGIAACLALAGCKHQQIREAELRWHARRARELERQVCQKEAEIHTLQQVMQARSGELPPSGIPAEAIYRQSGLSRVDLGMTTGSRDLDRDGTPDAVQFGIQCYDADGDAFKCPGSAVLTLELVASTGVHTQAGTWQIPDEELRTKWKSSLIGQGYQVVVPATLNEPKWRAHVQFTTLDGRVFEAEKTFEVSVKGKTADTGGDEQCPETPELAIPEETTLKLPEMLKKRSSSPSMPLLGSPAGPPGSLEWDPMVPSVPPPPLPPADLDRSEPGNARPIIIPTAGVIQKPVRFLTPQGVESP